MKRILIVEDDAGIRDLIAINLEMVGYGVLTAADGEAALKLMEEEKIDMALLDVMLPKVDGFSLVGRMKDKCIPVIFVTAREAVLDRVKGLRLGADDYIIKPFEAIELLARIEAVFRRYGMAQEIINYRHLEVFPLQRIVKSRGNIIELTPKEYELLMLLLQNRNIALSREQIIIKVWGYDFIGESRTVDLHVQRIRDKLELKEHIKTVFKVGYRLE